jgi:hypothetical protein
MTLMVRPYRIRRRHKRVRGRASKRPKLAPHRIGDECAGFERSRNDLWGHESAGLLGLVLLPSLAQSDLYAEGTALDALEAEVQTLLTNLDRFSGATGYSADYIESRCRNILRAIAKARAIDGGVYIG